MPVILDLLADGRTLSSDEIAEGVAAHFRLTNEAAWPASRIQERDGLCPAEAPGARVHQGAGAFQAGYHITDSGQHEVRRG